MTLVFCLLVTKAWGNPPPLSPNAGDVMINEIQTDGNNSIEYVELYFLATTNITGWTLHTNGPGGSADGSCTLPAGTYSSGTFLVIDDTNCLDWHTEQREIYILDENGDLVHYVSLWHSGNQDNQGDFGDPASFPDSYSNHVTDLNDLADDLDNYCANIDGSTPEGDWNENGDSCTPSKNQSNSDSQCSYAAGLSARYYNNQTLSGSPVYEEINGNIDYTWGTGSPNATLLGTDDFSIRWTGFLRAPTTGSYRIRTRSDDGVRLYLDGNEIIERWNDHGPTEDTATVSLTAGEYYPITLEYYENGGGAVIQLFWDPPGGGSDFTIIPEDNFLYCRSNTPLAYYLLNESGYTGASGEALDSSGNDNHGTVIGDAQSTNGYACRGVGVPNNSSQNQSSGIDTGLDVDNDIGSRGTVSFWYQSDVDWNNAGHDRVLFSANSDDLGGNNKYFFLQLLSSGRLDFRFEDSSDGDYNVTADTSTADLQAGEWVHIAATWDLPAQRARLFANGNPIGSLGNFNNTGQLSDLRDLLIGDNRSTYAEPGNSSRGALDEVRIYSHPQSSSQIQADMADFVDCPMPTTCFSDSFSGSLGDDWRTLTSSGSFTPQVMGGRLRLTPDANNIATAATLLRQFPSAGNKLVVEYDFYAYKDNGSTDDAADGITVTLSDRDITPFPGSYGGSLGYAQRSNGDPGFNGGWLGIGLDEYGNYSNDNEGRVGGPGFRPNAIAIRGSGSGTSGYAYLRGTDANLNPSVLTSAGTPHRYRITIDHTNGSDAFVTIERNANNGSGFQTMVDTFDVLDESGQSSIPTRVVLTLTGSTGGSSANHEIDNLNVCANVIEPYDAPIHHFDLVRNQANGLTCEPLEVRVIACADADCTSEYNGSFDVRLDPADGWAGGDTRTLNSGDVVSFLPDAPGTYTLGIPDSTPSAAPLTQNRCFIQGATMPEADCQVTFDDTGLRFFPSASGTSATALFDLVAGGDEGPFSVQAVRTDTTTGICEALFADGTALDFTGGTRCDDPGTCSADQQVELTSGGAATVLPNPEDEIGGKSRITLPLTFGTDSTAEFSLYAPDVGVQPMTLEYELPDAEGNPSGNTLSQTVNLRVRPAELKLEAITNADGQVMDTDIDPIAGTLGDAAAANLEAFADAGAPFTLEIQALNAQGDPTPNFGRTNELPTLNWGPLSTLVSPSAVSPGSGTFEGSAGTTSPGDQWRAMGDTSRIEFQPAAGLSFTELGVADLQGRIDAYLTASGTPDRVVETDVRRLGRFAPAYLEVTQQSVNTWGTGGYRYQGQAAELSAIELGVEAFNVHGDRLNNYDGPFFQFNLPARPLEKPTALTPTGGALDYDALTWTLGDNNDYDGTATLTSSPTNLNWTRKTTRPDANDTVRTVGELRIPAALLDDGEACHDSVDTCRDLLLDIASDPLLYYGRVNAEAQVAGTPDDVTLPLQVEVLSSVDTSQTPTLYDFQAFTGDSQTSGSDLTGLDHAGVCQPDSLNCATIANSADGNLTGITLGEGSFLVKNASGTPGIVGVETEAPAWLTWEWLTGTWSGPSSTLYFGQYQGRPPVLYQLEGFR